MKECSGKKVLIRKVSQDDFLYSSSQKINLVEGKIKDKRKFNMTMDKVNPPNLLLAIQAANYSQYSEH